MSGVWVCCSGLTCLGCTPTARLPVPSHRFPMTKGQQTIRSALLMHAPLTGFPCTICVCVCVCVFFLFNFIFLYTLLSLSEHLGSPTPQEQHYPVLQVHAGSFHVSVIPTTLTWITGSLTCVHDHSYVCVYIHTGGLGTPKSSQHNIFDPEKLTNLSCAPDGVRTLGLWMSSPTLYQLSHPVTQFCVHISPPPPSHCFSLSLSLSVCFSLFSSSLSFCIFWNFVLILHSLQTFLSPPLYCY